VIASNSNWPSAVDPSSADGREAFYKAVQKAIDAELASKPEEAK
jgi:hypothetical protein